MSFIKEWARNIKAVGALPMFLFVSAVAGYWLAAGLFTVLTILKDNNVPSWLAFAGLLVSVVLIVSLVGTWIDRSRRSV